MIGAHFIVILLKGKFLRKPSESNLVPGKYKNKQQFLFSKVIKQFPKVILDQILYLEKNYHKIRKLHKLTAIKSITAFSQQVKPFRLFKLSLIFIYKINEKIKYLK